MKYIKVVMYKTGDGKLHKTQKEAEQHFNDEICEMFENIIKTVDTRSLKISERDAICEKLNSEIYNIVSYFNHMSVEY